MKTELLYSQEWDTIEQFERALRAYIKLFGVTSKKEFFDA